MSWAKRWKRCAYYWRGRFKIAWGCWNARITKLEAERDRLQQELKDAMFYWHQAERMLKEEVELNKKLREQYEKEAM